MALVDSESKTPRLSPEERARLREIAAPVGRAARVLLRQGRTTLKESDLAAVGMLAVWSKLPGYDEERADFERWAFYQALHAMTDAARGERKEQAFCAAVRRGARGYAGLDERPAKSDFHRDTPDTDLARVRARTRTLAASAWLQPFVEQSDAGPAVETAVTAAETVQSVRDEIARLSDEQRTLVRLRFWDDAEVQQAAAQMGVPVRTLHRRWIETRELLLARLRGRGVVGIPEGFGEAVEALGAGETRGAGAARGASAPTPSERR